MTRPLQLRFYLLAVAAVVACLVWPSVGLAMFAGFAWVPLGLFMPVFGISCDECDSGTAPEQMQLVITGETDFLCTDCDTALNGTFVLNFIADPGSGLCRWISEPFTFCGANDFIWDLAYASLSTSVAGWRLALHRPSTGNYTKFFGNLTLSNPADCQFSGESFPPYASDLTVGETACSWTGSYIIDAL